MANALFPLDEGELRERGYDKTPDVKLEVPIGIYTCAWIIMPIYYMHTHALTGIISRILDHVLLCICVSTQWWMGFSLAGLRARPLSVMTSLTADTWRSSSGATRTGARRERFTD